MAKYYVKEGKALTTKKGIRSAGDELTPAMVEGGEEKLKELLKADLVTTEAPKKDEKEEAPKEDKKPGGAAKK